VSSGESHGSANVGLLPSLHGGTHGTCALRIHQRAVALPPTVQSHVQLQDCMQGLLLTLGDAALQALTGLVGEARGMAACVR